jgi:hypothetical protein
MTTAHPHSPAESICLDDILATTELERRPPRRSDEADETQTMLALTQQIAAAPEGLFPQLAQAACHLTGAGSAGVSVAETAADGSRRFRWRATAGAYFPFAGSCLPRDFSPCGVTIDRDAVQLMTQPERYYPYVTALRPPVVEVLLAPFHRRNVPVGTLWIVSHTADKRFDREDARLLVNLSRFASTAADMLADL